MKKGGISILILFIFICLSQIAAEDDGKISVEIEWDDDIINGEEFEMNAKAFNLEEKSYDIKVFITNQENKIISQTYNNDKWITSNNYIKNFFEGSGNKESKVKLRINNNYKDFEGEAYIGVRIRENGKTSFKENSYKIDIINNKKNEKSETNDEGDEEEEDEEEEEEEDEEDEEKQDINIKKEVEETISRTIETTSESSIVTSEVIKLGKSKVIEKTDIQDNLIFESKDETIKKYSIYGFSLLCVILIILLIFKKV